MNRNTRTIAQATATALGIGRIPHAPGTVASLATVIVLSPARATPALLWGLLAVIAIAGIWSSGACAKAWRRKDPPTVVIDEVLGMGLALALSPGPGQQGVVTAFVLFRLFDILKPGPISRLERLPGGLGIMADDVGAGLTAAIVMWLVFALSRTIPALQILIYY